MAVWAISISSSFQQCVNDQTASTHQLHKEKLPELTLPFGDHVAIRFRCSGHILYKYRDATTAVATIFIALFTFTLWFSTWKLWQAGDQQFKMALSKETPSILIIQIEINTRVIGGDESHADLLMRPSCFVVRYRNFGGSRAIISETCLDWDISKTIPDSPKYGNIRREKTGTIVEDKQPSQFTFGDYDIEFTKEQRDSLYAGETKLWVWGYITYRDIFTGAEHRTGFCSSWRRGDRDANTRAIFVEDGPASYRYQS